MRSWIRKRAYTNRNGYCGVSERRRMFCSFKVKGHTLPVSKLLIERHTLTFIAILHLYVLFKGIYGDIWTQWDVILWGQAKVSAPVPTIQHEILREGFRLDPLYIYLLRPYFYYFFYKKLPLDPKYPSTASTVYRYPDNEVWLTDWSSLVAPQKFKRTKVLSRLAQKVCLQNAR